MTSFPNVDQINVRKGHACSMPELMLPSYGHINLNSSLKHAFGRFIFIDKGRTDEPIQGGEKSRKKINKKVPGEPKFSIEDTKTR
jgi:hypothetical protein